MQKVYTRTMWWKKYLHKNAHRTHTEREYLAYKYQSVGVGRRIIQGGSWSVILVESRGESKVSRGGEVKISRSGGLPRFLPWERRSRKRLSRTGQLGLGRPPSTLVNYRFKDLSFFPLPISNESANPESSPRFNFSPLFKRFEFFFNRLNREDSARLIFNF